ncbi:MAG: hypothetical protein ABI587_01015 [Gemmatimonadales bacterium]
MRIARCLPALLALGIAWPAAMAAQGATDGGDLPPAGYGTIRSDQLSIRLALDDIELRFLPLDERVLRLVSKDGYDAIKGLIASRQTAIDSVAAGAALATPGLALVTFFALRADARFDPENVSLLYRNQFWRPVAIVPVTANFTGRQLPVRQQASAIYLFDNALPVYEQFDVVYGTVQSSAWQEALRRIDRERGLVMMRWQADQRDSAKRE